jgi:hypothetical protein
MCPFLGFLGLEHVTKARASLSAMTVSSDVRVKGYFPLVPKGCKEAAEPFFDCFTSRSVRRPDVRDANEPDRHKRVECPVRTDARDAQTGADVGRVALSACAHEMSKYEACVDAALARAPLREAARAGETYRSPAAPAGAAS